MLEAIKNAVSRFFFPKWRCFHCGFATSDPQQARAHFGEYGEGDPALCLHWAELDEAGRVSELQDCLIELEATRERELTPEQIAACIDALRDAERWSFGSSADTRARWRYAETRKRLEAL